MPNWCANAVMIKATTLESSEKLKQLETHLNDKNYLFDFFIKPDEELSGVEQWGTKWQVTPESFYLDGDSMEMYFDSAWSPPIKFYEVIHEEFDFDVNATFVEMGVNFIGYYVNGNYEEDQFVPDDFDYEADNYYEVMDEIKDKYFENTGIDHPVIPFHTGG